MSSLNEVVKMATHAEELYLPVKRGDLEVLESCLEKGYFMNESVFICAAEFNQIQVLDWLEKKGVLEGISKGEAVLAAAYGGALDSLKWLRSRVRRGDLG